MDDNLFDDQNIHPEASGVDDSLFDDSQEHPEVSSGTSMSYLPAKVATEAAASVGKSIPQAIDTGLTKFAATMGPFSQQQLENVKANRDQFKYLNPQESLSKLEEEFRTINRSADEFGKQALGSLEEGMTPQQLKQMVGETTTQFSRPVDLNDPTIQAQIEAEKAQLSKDFAKQQEKNLARANASDLDRFAAQKAEEAVQRAKSANMGALSDDVAETIRQNVIQTVKQSPEAAGFTPKSAPQDLLEQYNKLKAEAEAAIPARITESLQSPLAETFPELKGRVLTTAKPSEFTRATSLLPVGTTPMTGEEMWNTLRQLREEAYKPTGEVSKEVAKAVSQNVRNYVEQTSPEASDLFRQQSDEINRLKQLQNEGYLAREKGISKHLPESVQVGDKEAKKLFSDILGGKIEYTDDVAERLSMLQQNVSPKLWEELQLAAIKTAQLDPSKAFNIKPFEAAMGLGLTGVTGGLGILPSTAYLGTKYAKTPEGALKLSDLVNTVSEAIPQGVKTAAKTTGKVLGKALPVIGAGAGAYSGYEEAKQAGFDPWETAAYSAFEAVNPVPVSGIEAVKSYQKNTQKVSKDNINDYSAQFRTPDYRFQSTNTEAMQNLANRLAEYQGNKAAQGWAQELSQASQQSEQQKDATLAKLNQLKEFRELVRRTKGIKE